MIIALQEGIDDEKVFEMVVRRDCVLNDAFRRMRKSTFDPAKTLVVSLNFMCHISLSVSNSSLVLTPLFSIAHPFFLPISDSCVCVCARTRVCVIILYSAHPVLFFLFPGGIF